MAKPRQLRMDETTQRLMARLWRDWVSAHWRSLVLVVLFMGVVSAATGAYPAFSRLMAAFGRDGYDLDLDRLFELGLRTLLDGLTVLVEEP